MGTHTVIADVSQAVLSLLRMELTPEPIKDEQLIGVCSVGEAGSFTLNLYLYNIEKNNNMGALNRTNIDSRLQKDPPTPLTLYYMLSATPQAEEKDKGFKEQKIIGRAAQVLKDNSRLAEELLQGTLKENSETVEISELSLSLEEKAKVWAMLNQPYGLSLFYSVSPVYLDSEKVRETKRVVDVSIGMKER